MHRALVLATLLALVLSGCTGGGDEPAADAPAPYRASLPEGAAIGETILFADIGDPGLPEGIAIDAGRVFVTVSQDADAFGELLVYDLATAALEERIRVDKRPAAAGGTSRLLGVAADARGDILIADTGDPRILRISRGAAAATGVYAIIPDLPRCGAPGAAGACAPTTADAAPVPNYLMFGPEGHLYVTDIAQAAIFRIPPGGGEAQLWFSDARLGNFGANGMALSPDDKHVYLAQSYVEGISPFFVGAAGGALYRLPFVDSPAAAELELVRQFPRYGIDGITFGASGHLYLTMLGQAGARHGIAIVTQAGADVAFIPTEAQAERLDRPYFYPASIAFDDERRSILVTNQAFERPALWAVLETFVDDTALALHKPTTIMP